MKDYKEKLKKLIQRIENSIVNGRIDEKVDKAILKNFIVESEDEKIRKALIQYFSEQDGILTAINGNVSVGDILAWLEKQGEQKSSWSEEDEHFLETLFIRLDNKQENYPQLSCDFQEIQEIKDWLKSLKERVQPQLRQEWSKDDEKHHQGCLNLMKLSLDTKPYPYYNDYLWLKSLKERYT